MTTELALAFGGGGVAELPHPSQPEGKRKTNQKKAESERWRQPALPVGVELLRQTGGGPAQTLPLMRRLSCAWVVDARYHNNESTGRFLRRGAAAGPEQTADTVI